MRPIYALLLPLAIAGAVLVSCGDDGAGRRTVQISQTNDDCTPHTVDVAAGEKIRFEVKNEGSKDKEFEGIEGARVEEIIVPSGRARSINYDAPSAEGEQKVKCYVPGGPATVISLRIGAASDSDDESPRN